MPKLVLPQNERLEINNSVIINGKSKHVKVLVSQAAVTALDSGFKVLYLTPEVGRGPDVSKKIHGLKSMSELDETTFLSKFRLAHPLDSEELLHFLGGLKISASDNDNDNTSTF